MGTYQDDGINTSEELKDKLSAVHADGMKALRSVYSEYTSRYKNKRIELHELSVNYLDGAQSATITAVEMKDGNMVFYQTEGDSLGETALIGIGGDTDTLLDVLESLERILMQDNILRGGGPGGLDYYKHNAPASNQEPDLTEE